MSMNAPVYQKLLYFSLTCLSLFALASTLAGCGTRLMTPAHTFVGKMSIFHVPAPYSLPGTITVGPDGNLWFPAIAYSNFGTNRPSGAIGRMTPSGMFSMFTLPTLNTYPGQITIGQMTISGLLQCRAMTTLFTGWIRLQSLARRSVKSGG